MRRSVGSERSKSSDRPVGTRYRLPGCSQVAITVSFGLGWNTPHMAYDKKAVRNAGSTISGSITMPTHP
jgi:hypothetical protein